MKHELPVLGYSFDALEPYIDATTMRIHHDMHHGGYVDKLNAALEPHNDFRDKQIEYLLTHLKELPESIREAVRNNGGGHYNHSFFWQQMSLSGPKEPVGTLSEAINEAFGNFDSFKELFSDLAVKRFGSGWAWLVVDNAGNLKAYSTPNQESPITEGYKPVLCIDVWEHAYYLKYQNKRAEYVSAWWNVIDWNQIEKNFL
jgi:Fe-Mn family superoxide dismutase